MTITVNGENKKVTDHITVSKLFQNLNIKPQGKIVVLNREVVHQNNWDTTKLAPADDVEILTMVGGG